MIIEFYLEHFTSDYFLVGTYHNMIMRNGYAWM